MKRDMNIIRTLLLAEESGDRKYIQNMDRKVLAYHAQLLIDAELAIGTVHFCSGRGKRIPDNYSFERLTWAGHDFLDAARNEKAWKKVNEKILKMSKTVSFALLFKLLELELKKLLGMDEGN